MYVLSIQRIRYLFFCSIFLAYFFLSSQLFYCFTCMQGNTFSKIINCKQSNSHQCLSKLSPSTQPQESPGRGSLQYNESWQEESLCAELHKQVDNLQKSQEEMEKKFKKCIDQLLMEINKNNDINSRLATEVGKLKQEVRDSKQDIIIIDQFIKANMKREAKSPGENIKNQQRRGSSRDLLDSSSRSNKMLNRRSPINLFKSKISIKP